MWLIIFIIVMFWVFSDGPSKGSYKSSNKSLNQIRQDHNIYISKFKDAVEENKNNVYCLRKIDKYDDKFYFIKIYNKMIDDTKDIQNAKLQI